MRNDDDAAYLKYTGPQRIDKAMHSLEGIITGIAIDGVVNSLEIDGLVWWLKDHRQYQDPFKEVIERLDESLEDGVVDEEERADLLFQCKRFSTENQFFSDISSDMQRLQGIMFGIVADGEILEDELIGLGKWLDEHEHLKSCWPYDEVQATIMVVMADGKIDDDEHEALMKLFAEFTVYPGHRSISADVAMGDWNINGVCAVCPEIQFPERMFCFTGKSDRIPRKELAGHVESLGGLFSPRVTKSVDYLVVGSDGNPCWAYACYGRKVEHAIKIRKNGGTMSIVHEYDYWDAAQDAA